MPPRVHGQRNLISLPFESKNRETHPHPKLKCCFTLADNIIVISTRAGAGKNRKTGEVQVCGTDG